MSGPVAIIVLLIQGHRVRSRLAVLRVGRLISQRRLLVAGRQTRSVEIANNRFIPHSRSPFWE